MEGIMAVLADKEQPTLGSVRFGGMPTHGTCLTAVVGIDFDGHRRVQECLVGDHAVQFSKGPLRVHTVTLTLLLGNGLRSLSVLFAPPGLPFGALANVGQVLQSDEAMRVLIDDACGDHMI